MTLDLSALIQTLRKKIMNVFYFTKKTFNTSKFYIKLFTADNVCTHYSPCILNIFSFRVWLSYATAYNTNIYTLVETYRAATQDRVILKNASFEFCWLCKCMPDVCFFICLRFFGWNVHHVYVENYKPISSDDLPLPYAYSAGMRESDRSPEICHEKWNISSLSYQWHALIPFFAQ